MGNLVPGATYIYESPDKGKTVFARNVETQERHVIGYSFDEETIQALKNTFEEIRWNEIRAAARTNVTLKNAMDQCIMIYELSREDR